MVFRGGAKGLWVCNLGAGLYLATFLWSRPPQNFLAHEAEK